MNEFWKTLIFVALFLAICVTLVIIERRGLSTRAKRILGSLVAEAEAMFGAGTGDVKFAAVLSRLYAALPKTLQFLFSEETIGAWIEDAVAILRAETKDGEDAA